MVPLSEQEEKTVVNHSYLLKKQMEDHLEADTATLADDRQTPATFVPLARSQFIRADPSTVGGGTEGTSSGLKRDSSTMQAGDEEVEMEMTAEDEALVLWLAQPTSGEA